MAHSTPNSLGHNVITNSISRFDSPAAEGLEYTVMVENWRLPEALVGGTRAMRKAGEKYLPKNPKESDRAYNARLNRTFLLNTYKRTVDSLAAQPFIKPIQVDNVPPELRYLEEDADSTGRSLTEIAHETLWNQIHFGLGHILVDHPQVEGEITLAEQRQLKIRPYFNPISPKYLIFHDGQRIGGVDRLEEIRFLEFSVERVNDNFTEDYVQRVRSITPDNFTTFITSHPALESPFEQESTAENPIGFVPLVTAYGNKTGFLTGSPALEDLAWLNLRHWQTSSEQNNILHVARVPILFGRGFEEDEMEGMEIGANSAVFTNNTEAEMSYVEHSGAAIDSGANDLEKLEQQMRVMGSDLLFNKSVDRQTATARQIDKSESLSTIQLMLRNLENTIEQAYKTAGDWIGVDASMVRVTVGTDMALPGNESNSVTDLLELNERGKISDSVTMAELRRRGVLAQNTKEGDESSEQTIDDLNIQ